MCFFFQQLFLLKSYLLFITWSEPFDHPHSTDSPPVHKCWSTWNLIIRSFFHPQKTSAYFILYFITLIFKVQCKKNPLYNRIAPEITNASQFLLIFQLLFLKDMIRDAKTYKCANNVCIKKILSRVKSLQNFLLFCQERESSCNVVLFGVIFWHILEFYVTFGIFWTIWVFWAFEAVLLRIRYVVIYTLFRVRHFWLKPCL